MRRFLRWLIPDRIIERLDYSDEFDALNLLALELLVNRNLIDAWAARPRLS